MGPIARPTVSLVTVYAIEHNSTNSLRLTKPPRVRIADRLAHVQGKESLNAPDDCPNDPPQQNKDTYCKVQRQKPHEKIQKPDPKRCYLKLEV
jgi:hypothetical protein